MTKEQFKVIFSTKLVRAFSHIEVDKFKAKLYWEQFKDIPADKFSKASDRAIKESKFFPLVAELNEYIEEISGIISFEEAYSYIVEIIDKSYSGSWRKSDYPALVGNIIDKCGSIFSIRQMTSEEMHITTKKRYNDIVQEIKRNDGDVRKLR